MQLIVIWHNATRIRTEKLKVELEVRDYILEAFNGIENAQHSQYVHYRIAHQTHQSEWSRILNNAFNYAVRNLSDWEKEHKCFSVMFIPK